MDQQVLHGVTHPRSLHLGIEADTRGLLQISRGINIGVTDPGEVLDHRNCRALSDRANESFAAARNDHVNKAVLLEQQPDRLPIGGRDELDRRLW